MIIDLDNYYIDPIQEKDAWKICDFAVANEDRFKRFFPKTLEQNTTPTLSEIFVKKKVKQFDAQEEFLFTLKEKETNEMVGLIYLKELDWSKKIGEFAYCTGYPFEGKGLISKSIKALSAYALYTLGLKTLQIITHKSNLGSIKVAEKCGYIWQRTLPNEPAFDMELYELYA